MNDPTVVALVYRIEHGESVDYSEAKPLRREEPGFRVKIEDEEARFEFKGHHATEQAALQAIDGYVREWEFTAGLQRGPDCFRLQFVRRYQLRRGHLERPSWRSRRFVLAGCLTRFFSCVCSTLVVPV